MKHAAVSLILLAALVNGCVPTVTASSPYPPVPPLISEETPKPPVTAEPLMWQPGHWDWTGSGYIWARGQYVPAAGHGNLWQPGWWARTPKGWEWQPPHWMS